MTNITKVSWLTNSKRLQLESELTEKTIKIPLNSEELRSESGLLLKNRIDSKQLLVKKMFNFKAILNDIQSKIYQDSLLINNKLLKEQLEGFENKLTSFKVLMRNDFDVLEDSCSMLDSDVQEVQHMIDTWDSSAVVLSSIALEEQEETSKRISMIQKQDLERKALIGALDRKMATLSKNNSEWDPRDHDVLIRIWNQTYSQHLTQKISFEKKLIEDFDFDKEDSTYHDLSILDSVSYAPKRALLMKKLSTALPWKSNDEIENRLIWYINHLCLVLVKKKAVSDWKNEIVGARRKRNEDTLFNEVLAPNSSSVEDIFDELAGKNGSDQTSIQDREAAKQRIAKWKADRLEIKTKEEAERFAMEESTKKKFEEQKKRKQITVKSQLSKWKNDEIMSKEILAESNAKLLRPKSVDAAIIRERQVRDLELARIRCEKIDLNAQQKYEREKKIRDAVVIMPCNEAERNPVRLLSSTKASKSNSLTYENLDDADRRRRMVGAHDSTIAMTGRDLAFSGRAVPAWIKNAR